MKKRRKIYCIEFRSASWIFKLIFISSSAHKVWCISHCNTVAYKWTNKHTRNTHTHITQARKYKQTPEPFNSKHLVTAPCFFTSFDSFFFSSIHISLHFLAIQCALHHSLLKLQLSQFFFSSSKFLFFFFVSSLPLSSFTFTSLCFKWFLLDSKHIQLCMTIGAYNIK